jgi:hypothetical protein
MDEREVHSEKHDDPRISRFCGIWIDLSDEFENAYGSIRFSREFNSNEIDESDLQHEKHDDLGMLMFRSIVID